MARKVLEPYLEQKYGKPAREVIVEAFHKTGSLLKAAELLGVNANALYSLSMRLHLEMKKELVQR